MLTTLRIKNLALVADLTLELQPGYNVITGETGAGKSIVIGALSLVLGERADRTLIRSGCDSCVVEAVFDVLGLQASLEPFLETNGLEPCEGQQLVLKRTFTSAGTNRQFINGSPTSLSVLATVGNWLVDFHGPHEHQSLLDPARQLAILDAFGELDLQREKFAELVRRHAGLIAEKTALIIDERTYAQQLDLLRFQVSEISGARLRADEEPEVEQEYRRASNAAKLLELCRSAADILAESDTALLTQTGSVGRNLQDLRRLDPAAGPLVDLHGQVVALLQELQTELSDYSDRIEIEPARFQELEQRLNLIHSLKLKYGSSLSEVIEFGEDARRKLDALDQRDEVIERLNSQLKALASEIIGAGQLLTNKRRSIIPKIAKAVSEQLADLGFKRSRFDVALETIPPAVSGSDSLAKVDGVPRLRNSGFDVIDFQFAPNPGEPAKDLRAIASSGELARVMLALKTVLAAQDQIPVLVFDEVDANVGGETANAVGQKMRQIAEKRQVICITHLPQVAAPASAHYVANKQVNEGRTTSAITLVEKEERITELARMLGGQSDAARKHARALLKAV